MVILRGDPIDLWPMVALPEQPSGRCEHIRFDATGNLPAIDVTTDVRKKSSQRSLVIWCSRKELLAHFILLRFWKNMETYHINIISALLRYCS